VVYIHSGLAGHSLGGGSWQCIEEREDDGGTWEARRQYVYGGRYIDEPLIFDKDYDSDGICTDFNYGGSRGAHRYYYAQQVNYNVTAMVVDDGDGSVTFIEWAEYDPYGAATVTIADGQSATGNPYLFQGRRWEEESGLYYFRNRWYSAELGRFLQRDPIEYSDSMNMLAFLSNRAVSRTDPYGFGFWDTMADLCDYVPIISTFNNALSHALGTSVNDYAGTECPVLCAACKQDSSTEQIRCEICMVDALWGFLGDYLGINIPKTFLEGITGATIREIGKKIMTQALTRAGGILIIDAGANATITVVKLRKFFDAGTDAQEKWCDCSVFKVK